MDETKQEKLRIVGLQVDGFQNLNAIDLKFDPKRSIFFIRGDNGAGKTSIVKAVAWAFFGKKTIGEDVIGKDKQKMTVSVDVGEFKISRVYPGDKLNIAYPNGLTLERAKQKFLDTLANPDLTFRPFPFLNLDPKGKLKWMMNFMKIDFSEIDNKLESLGVQRRDVGRDEKNVGEIIELEKVDKVDPGELLKKKNNLQEEINREIQEIRDFNDEQDLRQVAIDDCQEEIRDAWSYIRKTEMEIEALQNHMVGLKKNIERLDVEFKNIPVPEEKKEVKTDINTDAIDQEILKANETNILHENWKQMEVKKNEKNNHHTEYVVLTDKIDELRSRKLKTLSDSKPDIPGLEITEDGIFWNKISIENLSDSEGLELAMMLCEKTNPLLNVFFVDRGESIGSKRLEQMEKFAEKNDIQLIITQVAPEAPGESSDNVFYLVAGKVAG